MNAEQLLNEYKREIVALRMQWKRTSNPLEKAQLKERIDKLAAEVTQLQRSIDAAKS